jgi:hypothetical protein
MWYLHLTPSQLKWSLEKFTSFFGLVFALFNYWFAANTHLLVKWAFKAIYYLLRVYY